MGTYLIGCTAPEDAGDAPPPTYAAVSGGSASEELQIVVEEGVQDDPEAAGKIIRDPNGYLTSLSQRHYASATSRFSDNE